jgi:hypothetical protein
VVALDLVWALFSYDANLELSIASHKVRHIAILAEPITAIQHRDNGRV